MKRYQPSKDLPVSQRQLARYLGISPSMLHMSESDRYQSHNLPAGIMLKKSGLVLAHQQAQKAGKPGPSARKRQEAIHTAAATIIDRLHLEAEYSLRKAAVLERRLATMAAAEKAGIQWLNTVDRLLATLPATKATNNDRTWLEQQQVLVLNRLQKTGPLVQATLDMQVQVEKAKAAISRAMIKKLKKGI